MEEMGWEGVASIVNRLSADLQKQRWFGAKAKRIRECELKDYGTAEHAGRLYLFPILTLTYQEGGSDDYFIPLAAEAEGTGQGGISIESNGVRYSDALFDRNFMSMIFSMLSSGESVAMQKGSLSAQPAPGFDSYAGEPSSVRVVSTEQSNTSVIVDGKSIYKSYRRLERGSNPDYEVPLRLSYSSNFASVPRPLGKLEYADDHSSTLGSLSEFVQNEGDCWTFFLKCLEPYLKLTGDDVRDDNLSCIGWVRKLGSMTAGLHNSLSSLKGEKIFSPVPVTKQDIEKWMEDFRDLVSASLGTLKLGMERLGGTALGIASAIIESGDRLLQAGETVRRLEGVGMHKIRIHGDYHLGQILKAGEQLFIIDFEGEPMRTLEYRRAPHCALRDVSGMLRSLDYSLNYTTRSLGDGKYSIPLSEQWGMTARQAFLESYWSSYSPGAAYLPPNYKAMLEAVRFFEIEKAVYELNYEMNNRPDWADIPMGAIARLSGISAQTINNDPG